eukprot:c9322_g1_i1.p1 GENE.c9322_g1_i1~~c9322_g1_i1.p1  ORF type:complete len:776 (+),score=196.88 c9322_g1_i1:67-2394(+)
MSESNTQGKGKRPDIIAHLKAIFPHMSDEQAQSVLNEHGSDEKKLNKWIESQLENTRKPSSRSSSPKGWSEVGKGAKKQKPRTASDADDRKLKQAPSRAKAQPRDGSIREGLPKPIRPAENFVSFLIPKLKHTAIIGAQGRNVQLIQSETGARVAIPSKDISSSIVQIFGDPTAIESARSRIQQLLNIPLVGGDIRTVVIDVPKRVHPILIGKGGAKLTELEQKFNCILGFPSRESGVGDVTIEGTRENIYRLKQFMEEMCRNDASIPFQFIRNDFGDAETVPSQNGTHHSEPLPAEETPVPSASNDHSRTAPVPVPSPAPVHSPPPPEIVHTLPVEMSSEDMQASLIADEMIDKLISTTNSFNLNEQVRGMPLPRANSVQLFMRLHLRERCNSQRRKCDDLRKQGFDDLRSRDELAKQLTVKEGLQTQLRTELQQLQLRLETTTKELQQLREDHDKKQKLVEAANARQMKEAKAAERLQEALAVADQAAHHITLAWSAWLQKLQAHSFDSWEYGDMNTLLACLNINPQIFIDNGIEPSMLGHIDDQLLKDLKWNETQCLQFGERRYLLIAVRSILNDKREPLHPDPSKLSQVSVREAVTYLMCWGLGIFNLATAHGKHVLLWTVQDVVSHFQALGQLAAANGCAKACVCGAVLLTMYRKDCFNLELGNLGDTVEMWKEVNSLQQAAFNRPPPAAPTHSWSSKDSGVGMWSVEDMAKFFETQKLPELAEVCRREKISGSVILSIERNDDLALIEFARPGDRIRLLQVCKQLQNDP